MDAILCQNLTKRFGDFTAVDDLNLTVAEGELFGFLGPNGAGKTTTIKMLTGLLFPTSGAATLGGYDIQARTLEAKSILGYVPDNPFLYEKLTGTEYLNFMADLYSVGLTGRERRIQDLLSLFELQNKGGEMIQGYSRGMRQKISLAGALIHSPKIVFLDEPTVGLDPKGARTMVQVLRELTARGTTVFVSTHILGIAERICDRVGIVNGGKLIALGTVEEIKSSLQKDATGEADGQKSLEDVFLELTGDYEQRDLAEYLD